MHTDDKPSGTKGSFLKAVAFVLLSTAVLVSAVLAYARSKGIDIEREGLRRTISAMLSFSGNTPSGEAAVSINFDIKRDVWLGVCGEYIVIFRNDNIIGFDENGNKKWEFPVEMHNPFAGSAGNFMAVADSGGKKICVIKGKNLVWERTLDKEIVNVTVNRGGYAAVTTAETEGHRSKVVVFDPRGVEIFSRKIAERYVVNSAVSPDNSEVVINTVDTGGVTAETGIEFTTILGKYTAGVKPGTDCIFPHLSFLDNGCVAAAGPTAIACFDKNKNVSWSRQYSSVYSAAVLNGRLAVALADKTKGTRARVVVACFLPNGDTDWTYEVGDKVVNIRAYDNILGINTGRELLFIINGKLVDSFTSLSEITDISFINKTKAVAVTRNSLIVYHLHAGGR